MHHLERPQYACRAVERIDAQHGERDEQQREYDDQAALDQVGAKGRLQSPDGGIGDDAERDDQHHQPRIEVGELTAGIQLP